jgi:hypothetical protein
MMGGGGKVVWWLGLTEKREKNGGNLYGGVKVGGKRRNSELKIGHLRVQLKCVRTYEGVFDRTCAECVCVKWALCSNVKGMFERIRASVCVCDGALQSNTRK